MVIASLDLNRLATDFVRFRPGARLHFCAQSDAVDFVCKNSVDLILFDVEGSLMTAFVLAAHMRASDRRRDACGAVAIVAAISSECKFQDCLVGGSAIDGALKMPCDARLFAECVDQWCFSDEFRSGSPVPARTPVHWKAIDPVRDQFDLA